MIELTTISPRERLEVPPTHPDRRGFLRDFTHSTFPPLRHPRKQAPPG